MTRIKVRKGQYRIVFSCDYCGIATSQQESAFNRKKRHFCSMDCYANYRRDILPREEQPRYGARLSRQETESRRNARSMANHAIRDGKIVPQLCEVCGNKAEAHHDDYSKPLNVRWLCFKHHRQWHHENQEWLA